MAEKKEEFCTVLVISADAPEDAAAASGLRKRLEQFRLPSHIRNTLSEGQERIRALSAEGPDAAEAEENSQWLAVVCSPRLKDSEAAMDVIRRFKERKGQERILAVLLEGEPADSFPERSPAGTESQESSRKQWNPWRRISGKRIPGSGKSCWTTRCSALRRLCSG